VLRGGLAALVAAAAPAWAAPRYGLLIADPPRALPPLALVDATGAAVGGPPAGRPALINLWASWCPPCVAELPALDRLAPDLDRRGISLVAVSFDRDPEMARATWRRLGLSHLTLRLGDSAALIDALDARALPVTLLLDMRGREIGRIVGAPDWASRPAAALFDALAAGRPLDPAMSPPPLPGTHG